MFFNNLLDAIEFMLLQRGIEALSLQEVVSVCVLYIGISSAEPETHSTPGHSARYLCQCRRV